MKASIVQMKRSAHPADVIIEMKRNACSFCEFWRVREWIMLVRARAAAALAHEAGSELVRRVRAG